jgi:CubicO group peptidase (beta-lactamase class C family)
MADTLPDDLTRLADEAPSLVVLGPEGVSFVAGFADREQRRPPTLDTAYGIGSTSKTFAALAALRLVANGALDLHRPVTSWLGESPLLDGITTHHLLSHTSGLPPLPARFAALDRAAPAVYSGGVGKVPSWAADLHGPGVGFVDAGGLLEFLRSVAVRPLAPPGRIFSYSNEGYVLAAGVIAAVSGVPYEDFCTEQILGPLGLACTAFIGSERAAQLDDVAVPYVASDDGFAAVEWWDAPAWASPGGLLSSANDLERFATALREAAVPGLPADLVRTMSAPHADRGWSGWYGYGLMTSSARSGGYVVGHAGGRIGTSADLIWSTRTQQSAVALSNLSGPPITKATRILLGHVAGAADDPLGAMSPPELPAVSPAAAAAERVVGDYYSAELDYAYEERLAVRITENDRVSAGIGELKMTLEPCGAWLYRGDDVELRFLVDGTSPAWAVKFGERVLTREPYVGRRAG